jgi:hypothetical protein
METSSLALTGPNVLVHPLISRTTGASRMAPVFPSPVLSSANPKSSDSLLLWLLGDLYVAAYNAPLGLFHLVLYLLRDVAVVASERGEAHALLL